MSFPIHRVEAGPGLCKRCGGETRCVNEEHVDDLLGIPLARKYMWFARCRACGLLDHRRADATARGIVGKSKGAWKWLAGTWFVFGLITASIIACALWQEQREQANALSPIVGDQWTFRVAGWPDDFQGAKYGRVKVIALHEDAIEIVGCTMTYDEKSDVRRKCDSYDLPMYGVPRNELASKYLPAIEDVDSSRDDHHALYIGFGITAGLLLLWRIIAMHWKQRTALAEI